MPEERAAKRKSHCKAVFGRRVESEESETQRESGRRIDVGAVGPAGCNQTRVNRLLHRWLIQRILRFIFPPQTVSVTACR